MTGPEHFQHAEVLLDMAGDDELGSDIERYRVAKAQVHATLALAASAEDDTRRLDRIRVVLAKFDWEHDDRQLALEAIDRIADGGQP